MLHHQPVPGFKGNRVTELIIDRCRWFGLVPDFRRLDADQSNEQITWHQMAITNRRLALLRADSHQQVMETDQSPLFASINPRECYL